MNPWQVAFISLMTVALYDACFITKLASWQKMLAMICWLVAMLLHTTVYVSNRNR